MAQDQRECQKPVPDNLDELISLEQLATISKLESFGWELFFVRRSNPDEIIPVMLCPITSERYTAVVDNNGAIIRNHDILIRDGDKLLH